MSEEKRTCRTCLHWYFKSSAEKAWGRCVNGKVHAATYITFNNIPDGVDAEAMMKAVKCCEIRFEENTFGCIHHTPTPED